MGCIKGPNTNSQQRPVTPGPPGGGCFTSQTFSPHVFDVPVVSRKDSSRTCVRPDVWALLLQPAGLAFPVWSPAPSLLAPLSREHSSEGGCRALVAPDLRSPLSAVPLHVSSALSSTSSLWAQQAREKELCSINRKMGHQRQTSTQQLASL